MYLAPDLTGIRSGFTDGIGSKRLGSKGLGSKRLGSKLGRFTQSLLLSVGAGVLGMVGSASAAETILLRFDETQISVPIQEIEAFAASGAVDGDLQEFFQKYPEIQAETQDILDQQITVTEAFIQRTLSGSTGEFVLIQLRKLLNDPSGDADIESLRTTLIDAYEDDNRFSVLELLQKYPESEIYVDLRGLQQVYGDVVTFVERIQPILETAREYLQDLVCDCPTPTASGGGGTSATAVKAADCIPAAATTTQSPEAAAAPTVSTVSEAPAELSTEPAGSSQPTAVPESK